MKVESKSITFLGNEGIVQIPFFQRAYVWGEDNWEDMLEELLTEKNHFLGSLILKQLPSGGGEVKSALVIDGQQRLTTLSILLKAIYDLFPDEKRINSPLLGYLFYKEQPTDTVQHIKIKHSKIDKKYFQQVIGEVENNSVISSDIMDSIDSITEKSNQILKCYKYFHSELSDHSEEERERLFNKLLNTENKIIVVIDLSDEDNEQAIFDTINNAGIRLTCTDTIKNSLFQRAVELMGEEKAIKLYEESWSLTFSDDEEGAAFWSTQKGTGRHTRDNSEILLQSVAIINKLYDPTRHTLSELPDLYKKKSRDCDERQLRNLLGEISEYAAIYREKIPLFRKGEASHSFGNYVKRLFHILDSCDIASFHPYVIFLLKKYEDNEDLLKKRLKELEDFVIRKLIAKETTRSYNTYCKEFINNEDLVKERSDDISQRDIENGIKSMKNKPATLILFWVELYRRHNDSRQSIKELKYDYSLEHIMPKKWREHWSSTSIVNDEGNEIADQAKGEQFRDERVLSLGNMTLLNSNLNATLQNHNFTKKVNGEGKKGCMRKYSELSLTAHIVADYDAGNSIWNEKSIFDREQALTREIEEIWCQRS